MGYDPKCSLPLDPSIATFVLVLPRIWRSWSLPCVTRRWCKIRLHALTDSWRLVGMSPQSHGFLLATHLLETAGGEVSEHGPHVHVLLHGHAEQAASQWASQQLGLLPVMENRHQWGSRHKTVHTLRRSCISAQNVDCWSVKSIKMATISIFSWLDQGDLYTTSD